MLQCFSYLPYERKFIQPLQTARGSWAIREGFIIRVDLDGRVGFGEVAPIPEFGSETLTEAAVFLDRLVKEPELAEEPEAFIGLPSCAFAVSSALSELKALKQKPLRHYRVAGLLPAGGRALDVAAAKAPQGYHVFKWKIGVDPVEIEQEIFRGLDWVLPEGVLVRLDANGGLSEAAYEKWLGFLADFPARIDFLEQPLAVGSEAKMADFAAGAQVAVGLDESLNGSHGAHWLEHWKGPLVIKPLLAGDRGRLIERLRPLADRVILSSVFETPIGLENVFSLMDRLPETNRAIGFDTSSAFDDALSGLKITAHVAPSERSRFSAINLWNHLSNLT